MNTDLHRFFKNYSRSFVVICFLFSLFIFSNCSSKNQAAEDDSQTDNANAFEVGPPTIDLSKPLEISEKTEDVALAKKVDEIIEKSDLSNARWGVFVVSLKDGRVIVAKDARKLFNPASIQKTLTAIVALDKLGADFRWKTHVYGKNQIEPDGSLNGDLTLYGEGAPDFNTESLNDLVNQLQAKGLKKIKGNIVGDESYFTGDDIGDGWVWGDLQWYYGAQASALTYNENHSDIIIDGEGKTSSPNDLMQIKSDLKPKNPGERDSYGMKRGLANNEVYVWGNSGATAGQIAVHDPALWAAKTLKNVLAQKGIIVEGEAKSADWKTENKFDPLNSVELASVQSKTLAEIVQRMNKRSVNLYAELLLRTIGKKFGDTAPNENKSLQNVRGDDSAGTSVIKKFLTDEKVATTEIEIHDGSGLSRLDFVTPEAFGRALIYAAQSKFANVFENSLPVAGTDGTLGGRLGTVKGNILAKTGSITFVSSLAGYAKSKDEIFAFAIICNNATKKSDSARVIDQIAASLVKESDKTLADETNLSQNSANKESKNSSEKKSHKEK